MGMESAGVLDDPGRETGNHSFMSFILSNRRDPGAVDDQSRGSHPAYPFIYRNRFIPVQVNRCMDHMRNNFWIGSIIGAVIIIIIDLIVPFLGPFIGGFIAGYIAKGDILNAGKAGLLAGILAAVVVSLIVFAGMVSHPVAGYLPMLTGVFLSFAIILYLAIIAFLGGIIAGAVRK
jgi:hypothetical protein